VQPGPARARARARAGEQARVRESRRAEAAERVQQRRRALEVHRDGRAEQRHAVAVQAQRAAGQAERVVEQDACGERRAAGPVRPPRAAHAPGLGFGGARGGPGRLRAGCHVALAGPADGWRTGSRLGYRRGGRRGGLTQACGAKAHTPNRESARSSGAGCRQQLRLETRACGLGIHGVKHGASGRRRCRLRAHWGTRRPRRTRACTPCRTAGSRT